MGLSLAFVWLLHNPRQCECASDKSPGGVFFPTHTEHNLLWRQIEKARERGDSRALLEGLTRFTTLIVDPQMSSVLEIGGELSRGIREVFREFVMNLPPEELARFKTRVNPLLSDLWRQSRLRDEPEAHRRLRSVFLRDLPFSEVYLEGLKEEVDQSFEVGDWQAVLRSSAALLDLAPGAEDALRARVIRAQALASTGESIRARDEIRAIDQLRRTVKPESLPPELLRLLDGLIAAAVLDMPASRREGIAPRAEGSFEARAPAGASADAPPYRLGEIVWEHRVPGAQIRAFVEERSRGSSEREPPTPYFPSSRGGVILLEHADRLQAYDAETSRELWSVDISGEDEDLSSVRMPLLTASRVFHTRGRTLAALDSADGRSLWQKTCVYDRSTRTMRIIDGPAPAFSLEDPLETENEESTPTDKNPDEKPDAESGEKTEAPEGPDLAPPDEDHKPEKKKKRAPSGKLVAKKGLPGSRPRTLYSLSPAAECGESIVVSVSVRIGQESLQHLLSLRSDGELEWQIFLGSSQGGNYLGLGGAASLPIVTDDAIFHLTNIGCLAKVDRADGAIRWVRSTATLSARGRRESVRVENRWHPNPLLLVEGQLIVAPQDSALLFALDPHSGETLWTAPRDARTALIGADARACFLTGSGASAVAHSGPQRGQTLWRVDSLATASQSSRPLQASGRPFLENGQLLFPTREALLALSPEDGHTLWRTSWELARGGGNLLLVGGATRILAVSNASGNYLYNGMDLYRKRVAGLPADRTEALLERAKLELRVGDVPGGLEALKTWVDSAPPSPQPNSPLDHLHLDVAELAQEVSRLWNDEKQVADLLRYRVRLERTPSRRVTAAIELAAKLDQLGDATGAAETLHEALLSENPQTTYSPDGVLAVESVDYIRDKILELRKSSGETSNVFQKVDAIASEALRRARSKIKTPGAYRDLLRLFPFTPSAAEAYLDLARLYRDAQGYEQAINALDGYLRDFPEGQDLVKVKLLAANLLRQSGQAKAARDRYLDLLEHHGASPVEGVEGARPGEAVEAYIRPLLGDSSLAEAAMEQVRPLRFPIRMSWRSPADLQAIKRSFLAPRGTPPERSKNCFLTQSEDVIEMREVESGLPVWKINLEMIPGFRFNDPGLGRGFHLPRVGRLAFSGRYMPSVTSSAKEETLLVLNDEQNLFAVEPVRGTVRWHLPIGGNEEPGDPSEPLRVRLREKLRGVQITAQGIFATTRSRVLRLSLQGELVWEARVGKGYNVAVEQPIVLGDRLYVITQPFGLRIHAAASGEEIEDEELSRALASLKDGVYRVALSLEGGRVGLTNGGTIKLLDLVEKRVRWEYKRTGTIEDAFHFAEAPDECLLSMQSKANRWPILVMIDLASGRELWSFEKFKPEASSVAITRDRNKFYVVYGQGTWKLVALQVREGVAGEKQLVEPLWPAEAQLGGGFGAIPDRIQAGGDSIFFLDAPNSIATFDKSTGAPRSAQASMVGTFLAEKKDCSFAVLQGKLVILTDGGDCAFESADSTKLARKIPFTPQQPPQDGADGGLLSTQSSPITLEALPGSGSSFGTRALKLFLSNPGAVENTTRLALEYFRGNDLPSAMNILNRALLSEEILNERGAEKRFLLSYMLDGLKEEWMKESVPTLSARHFSTPPAIDGDLSDPWDVSTRVTLSGPKYVGTIPVPEQLRDWEGDEDLSAILYTGWDEKFFYFALDVSDDNIYPYDRDAENWKGDCLIIGLDPTNDGGYWQHGNDQLMTLALTVPKRNKLDKPKKDDDSPDGDDEEEDEDEERKPAGLFSVKKKDDNSGAIYEVGLPWASFQSTFERTPPPGGYTFGLSLLLTDDDRGQGATKTLSINPCHLLPRNQKNSPVWRFIIPNFFPKVTLE